jgi:hypothetical protein
MTSAFVRSSHRGVQGSLLFVALPVAMVFGVLLGRRRTPRGTLSTGFADAHGVRLEYFEFGNSGTPVIVIQDHHDYFHDSTGDIGLTMQRGWVAFLESLGETYRVIATVRRGWGESEPLWGSRRIGTSCLGDLKDSGPTNSRIPVHVGRATKRLICIG